MSFPTVLLLAVLAQAAPPQKALDLVQEVSQRYANAKSYHVDAVEERSSSSELSRDWQKSFMTAIVIPGGHYRYEGRYFGGNAVLISDGTSEWEYLPDQKAYTQRPVSSDDAAKRRIRPQDEVAALNAKAMVGNLSHLAEALKSATFLPDENVVIAGKNADCYVIRAADVMDDFRVRRPNSAREWTLWIDKSRKILVKKLERATPLSDVPVNGMPPRTTETTTIYPVVELDKQESASTFTLNAPADARLVEELPNPFFPGARSAMIGRPAPELHFKSANGKLSELSSLRGKPVFLDFWATWCGPCKGLVPDLLKLYQETSPLGLTWVGIDNDQNPDAADKFIAKENLPWPNYHDLDGSMGAAFQRNPIPLGVLIDARGNVAFYQVAYEMKDLRAAIGKLGPEFGSVAKTAEASSANPTKKPD